jgi:hypothetical protein
MVWFGTYPSSMAITTVNDPSITPFPLQKQNSRKRNPCQRKEAFGSYWEHPLISAATM